MLLNFAGWTGIKSLLVIFFVIFTIFYLFIGWILVSPQKIIFFTLGVSILITLITQIVVSGFKAKTLGAILGTIGGVVLACLLSYIFIPSMHLTGLENEEAMLLKTSAASDINFSQLLFSGIIFGSLGAVMDVAISISSAQQEIKKAQSSLSFFELFTAGMNVGKDVMGTMSNTLVLAYIGSSLPLILLISSQQELSLLRILNMNLIATEITRTLIGTTGLLCAIPFTALITAYLLSRF